jgi:hypothetical protein
MLHENRITYMTLKTWALEAYYEGCRDHAMLKGWSHEQILGYVAYSFEDGFERPIENIMWQVILLILSGGWYPDREKIARSNIQDLLKTQNFSSFFSDLPTDEIQSFRHDLEILKII